MDIEPRRSRCREKRESSSCGRPADVLCENQLLFVQTGSLNLEAPRDSGAKGSDSGFHGGRRAAARCDPPANLPAAASTAPALPMKGLFGKTMGQRKSGQKWRHN